MDGDVVFLGGAGQGERVVLPQRDSGTAEENVLSSPGLGVLLLDLDLANIAGVLNNLGNVRLVASTNLTSNTLSQVDETAVHPVLPKHTDGRSANAGAERSKVGLNHAEGTVDGPEEEEDDEHVVSVPESLIIGTAGLLDRGEDHTHERDQHDIASPAGSGDKVGQQPAVDSEVVLGGDLSKVVPVGNSVDPREEDNGPSGGDVEGDVLVELDDSVERSLTGQGDERAADGEKDQSDVDVEHQRS